MRRSGAAFPLGARPEQYVYFFERPAKTREAMAQGGRAPPGGREIAGAKSIGGSDGRDAQGPVFVGPLGPHDAVFIVDPQGESHVSSRACLGRAVGVAELSPSRV